MPQVILHWIAKEQLKLLFIVPVTPGEMQLIEQKKLKSHEFTKSALHFRLPNPLMLHIDPLTRKLPLQNNISNAQSMDIPVFIVPNCSASGSQQERVA